MRFHIGIRVDEIVSIFPNKDEKADEWPTSYTLRSGSRCSTTGDWLANVAKVEALLNEDRYSVEELAAARRSLADVELQIKQQKATLASLKSATASTDGLAQIVAALGPVFRKERQYPRAFEVEMIKEALRGMGVDL